MKISKSELQAALGAVKPGLGSGKSFIAQSTSFAFLGDRLATYNDEISISYPVSNLNVRGAIRAQTLYDFLSKVKMDEVEILEEESQIVIKSERNKAGFSLERDVTLPIEEIGEIGDWQGLPGDFIEALKLCVPCCAKDHPTLSGIHACSEFLEASDGYQLIRHQLGGSIPMEFLLPVGAAGELIGYDVREIAEGKGWVHFRTVDGVVFSSRTLQNKFPNVDNILNMEGTFFVFPKAFASALEKASVFAAESLDKGTHTSPTVTIEIANGTVRVSSKNDHSWFEGEASAEYEGDAIKFGIGINFLSGSLDRLRNCLIGSDRVKFVGYDWVQVIVITPLQSSPPLGQGDQDQ